VALACILTRTAEGYALIDKAVIPDNCGFADYNSCSVVDNKAAAYLGARVNFNTGFSHRSLRDKPRNKLHIVGEKPMGSSMAADSLISRIQKHYFNTASCGGIALLEGGYILFHSVKHKFLLKQK
jgi:hypothetical protein